MVELLRSMRASAWQELIYLRAPNAVAFIVPSFDVALVLALLGAIAAELAGASAGLGNVIQQRTLPGRHPCRLRRTGAAGPHGTGDESTDRSGDTTAATREMIKGNTTMALSRHLAATTMIGLLAIAPAAAEDLHQGRLRRRRSLGQRRDRPLHLAAGSQRTGAAPGRRRRQGPADRRRHRRPSQAVAAGNAFYTWGGMTSLIAAATQDAQLVIISFDAGNNYRVAVPPDSPIRTVEDLKGKTIGTQSLGAAAYLYGLAVVGNAGLNAQRDVRWLPIGVGAQAVSALQSGQAAAYAGYDNPNAIIGILMGNKLRDLASPLNDLKGMSGILVRRDTLAKYPAVVAGLCKSLYASFVFAPRQPGSHSPQPLAYLSRPETLQQTGCAGPGGRIANPAGAP